MTRLLTAVLLIPVVLAGVFLLPDRWFYWGIGIVILPAAAELARLCQAWSPALERRTVVVVVLLVGALLEPAASGAPVLEGGAFAVLVVLFLAVAFLSLRATVTPREVLPYLGSHFLACIYVAVPWAALGAIKREGAHWVLLLLAVVWLCDSGAYYAGRAFGRHKLAPVASPNKTWEGAIAGTAAAVAGGVGWSLWQWETVEPILLAWVVGLAVAGQIGDLFESKIKRGAGVKDSSDLLPGHGGMLDRIDALLFAAPLLALALGRFDLAALGRS